MRRAAVLIALAALATAALADGAGAARSPLDGRWTWTWTAADLSRAGANAYDRRTLTGAETCVFANGRYEGHNLNSGRRDGGRFLVRGNVLTFIPDLGPAAPRAVELRFSVYRNRLTWSTIPGRAAWNLLPTTPWTRAG